MAVTYHKSPLKESLVGFFTYVKGFHSSDRVINRQVIRRGFVSATIDINDRLKEIREEYKLKHANISFITGYAANTVKKWFLMPKRN